MTLLEKRNSVLFQLDQTGNSPLHLAFQNNHAELALKLLEAKPSPATRAIWTGLKAGESADLICV